MKKKMIFLSSLALILGLVSCNKDEAVKDSAAEGTMGVTLKVEESILSRAATSSVTDGSTAIFNGGYLYFVNEVGQITEYFTVSQGGTTLGRNVTISDLTRSTGVQLTSINSASTDAYMIGNVPAGLTMPQAGNISLVTTMVADLKSQTDATGGVTNVSLFGSGEIMKPVGLSVDPSVQIDLAPIASRVELSKITGGGDIQSYKVSGVFINYFYTHGQLDGNTNVANYVEYTSLDNFSQNTTNLYTAGNQGILFDYNVNGIGTMAGLSCTPAPAAVWAYNLFAGDPFHIVVRLENVVIDDSGNNTDLGTKYLTVKKLRYKAQPTYLTQMKGGEIYTIDELKFDENDLKDYPEEESAMDVDVTVRLMKWTHVPVDYEY